MSGRASPRSFLYIDASTAGISGNMLLGALLDAIPPAPRKRLIRTFQKAFARKGFSIASGEVQRRGFRGFHIDATERQMDTHDLPREVTRAGRALKLSPPAAALAMGVIDVLLDSEAAVHGKPRKSIHLHELSAYDTVFDACACACALDTMGFFASGAVVFARPVEVGSGTVSFSHGTTSVPPPVSELILHRHRIPFTQRADREVATPTGLALLACLKPQFGPPPASVVRARGAGAGTMELPDRPNLLVVQVRERADAPAARPVFDSVAQVEVSLDDVTGETAAHAIARALDEGALDAHLVHTLTKKGRPGQLLLVVCREEDAEAITELLVEETGSWGIRVAHRVARYKAVPRTTAVTFSLGSRSFKAQVKYLEEGGRVVRLKAEPDDVSLAARKAGTTLAQARDAAEKAARRVLEGRRKRP